MIVIEGPDKAGKSTLAKLICEKFDGRYFHFENPAPGVVHSKDFIQKVYSLPYNTVFDRGCLSGFAYDFKAPSDPTRVMTTLRDVDEGMEHLSRCMGLLIYVTAYNETLSKRLEVEGDANDYVVERELLFVSHVYDLLFQHVVRQPKGRAPHALVLNTSTSDTEAWVNLGEETIRTFLHGYKHHDTLA